MRVLVTGGAGFVGSHAVVALMEAGHEPVVIDNLSNAHPSVVRRIGEITGTAPEFHERDVRDREAMAEIVSGGFDACIHFAALKAVGESVERPMLYYENNMSAGRSRFSTSSPSSASRTSCSALRRRYMEMRRRRCGRTCPSV